MKFQKIACLGFSGSELEDSYWQELDKLTQQRVLVATPGQLSDDVDGLLVKLGAKVPKELIDKLPKLLEYSI